VSGYLRGAEAGSDTVPPGGEPEALCTRCGLCCDGTFFGSVVVAAAERAPLARLGLSVVGSDVTSMPQPCAALRGCLCAVYEGRPGACARYACALRTRLASGARSAAEAAATVARMRELLELVRAAFDCPKETSIWEAILALEEPATAEGEAQARKDYGAAIDAVGALLELGRAEFEPRFAGGAR
jgi:Fe-S-cluster containining protein